MDVTPKKNWLSRPMIFGYAFLFIIFAGFVGLFYYLKYLQALPPVPCKSELVKGGCDDSLAGLPVESDDFKTYRNSEYGFEVQILKEWIAIPLENPDVKVIDFLSPESMALIGNSPGPIFDIRFSVSEKPVLEERAGVVENMEKKIINGMEFTYYISIAQCDTYSYQTVRNGLVYTFATCGEDGPTVLEKTLSTFKFTND